MSRRRSLGAFGALAATVAGACRSDQATSGGTTGPVPSSSGAAPPSVASSVDAQVVSSPPPPVSPSRVVDPLARVFPELAARCPSLPLAAWPAPFEAAAALGARVGVPTLWLKRDDQNARLYAGSKLRKLAYYLADAKARGADELITLGALGSHQVVATAAHGQAAGFRVTALLASTPLDEEGEAHLLAAAAFGATLRLVSGIDRGLQLAAELARKNPRAYVIPPGGSSPLGSLGFLRAALELVDDIRTRDLSMPAEVFVPLGTMGSATALAIGFALAFAATEREAPIRVMAVRVANETSSGRAQVDRLIDTTIAWWAARDASIGRLAEASALAQRAKKALVIVPNQLGAGYARPTSAGRRAVAIAQEHGLTLETTYTGKCFAALSAASSSLGTDERPVVFWQTHNALALPVAVPQRAGDDPIRAGEETDARRALIERLPRELRLRFSASKR